MIISAFYVMKFYDAIISGTIYDSFKVYVWNKYAVSIRDWGNFYIYIFYVILINAGSALTIIHPAFAILLTFSITIVLAVTLPVTLVKKSVKKYAAMLR